MFVVVAQFYTDGDFRVDAERAGLAHENDSHDYCGAFLCNDAYEVETVLMRLNGSIDATNDHYIQAWLIRTFGEALRILQDEPATLQYGWSAQLTGNYEPTRLFMQTVREEKDE